SAIRLAVPNIYSIHGATPQGPRSRTQPEGHQRTKRKTNHHDPKTYLNGMAIGRLPHGVRNRRCSITGLSPSRRSVHCSPLSATCQMIANGRYEEFEANSNYSADLIGQAHDDRLLTRF